VSQPGGVAVAEAPDFRRGPFDPGEGVAARRAAVAVEAQDLADVIARLARDLAMVAVAAGDVEKTVGVDRHAPAIAAERRPLAAALGWNRRGAVPRGGDE